MGSSRIDPTELGHVAHVLARCIERRWPSLSDDQRSTVLAGLRAAAEAVVNLAHPQPLSGLRKSERSC